MTAKAILRTALASATLCVACHGADSVATLNLKPEVTVRGGALTLGQLLDVKTDDAGLAKMIEAIPIGKAPFPGRVRLIGAETIRIRLLYEGIDPRLVTFNGGHVKVRTDAIKLSSKEIVNRAIDFARKLLPFTHDDVDIVVVRAPQDAVIPKGEAKPTLKVSQSGSSKPWGKTQFIVRVIVGDEEVLRAPVFLDIKVFGNVAVTLADIRRGEGFTDTNVGLRRMDITHSSKTMSTVDSFLGKKAGRPIRAFTPLTHTMLARTGPVMRRGDLVTMLVEEAGLRIIAQAQVVEDGRVGQTVRVRNLRSKRDAYGRVVDARTVRVIF